MTPPPIDARLFLVAIRDIGLRYGLGTETEPEVMREALRLIESQAHLALTMLGTEPQHRARLEAEWDAVRVHFSTPRYLRDPMLAIYARFVDDLHPSIKSFRPDGQSSYHFDFEYHCGKCGGVDLDIPPDPQDSTMVRCAACGHSFGTYYAVTELCRWIGRQTIMRLRAPA